MLTTVGSGAPNLATAWQFLLVVDAMAPAGVVFHPKDTSADTFT